MQSRLKEFPNPQMEISLLRNTNKNRSIQREGYIGNEKMKRRRAMVVSNHGWLVKYYERKEEESMEIFTRNGQACQVGQE